MSRPLVAAAPLALAALLIALPAAAQGLPAEEPVGFRTRLETTVVPALPIVIGDVCEQDLDLVSCTTGFDPMPGGSLELHWRLHEHFSVGLGTGLFINPAQPLPKDRDKDLGKGVWVWRSVFEPRGHIALTPILDGWVGAHLGWAEGFYEETSTGKNVTEHAGTLTFGGGLGIDVEVAKRFAAGFGVQLYGVPFSAPRPILKEGPRTHMLDGNSTWLELGLRFTTHLPL